MNKVSRNIPPTIVKILLILPIVVALAFFVFAGLAVSGDDVGVNVPPTILNFFGPSVTEIDALVSHVVNFTDPAVFEVLTAVFDWDDGSKSECGTDGGPEPLVDTNCSIEQSEGVYTALGSHIYRESEIYDIQFTVTDSAGGSDTSISPIVVYDPNGGFVTGGGWINSPPGAYVLDPSLEGRAHFGFVSKYQKGATTPTGQTEFYFKAGDLNFHSDRYDWLVVNGNNYAMFKGEGTVNGNFADSGNLFKFRIWAGDGNPDTFRIKIWDEDSEGVETVTYDNLFDQAIEGGSIVIHTKK